MKYHEIYLHNVFENVHHTSTAQVFQNARDSLTITDLIFDIKLYLNTLSIQVLRLMSNSAAVLHLSRTRLLLSNYPSFCM